MSKTNIDESLFEIETRVLQQAVANLANEQYRENELFPQYAVLVNHYQKLLRATRKVFLISDSQGRVLQRHQSELQNLLDNANQGFLTFGRDFKIDRQHSAECTRIFGRKIAGRDITDLLGGGSPVLQTQLQAVLARVLAKPKRYGQQVLQDLPAIFRINEKDIRVECKVIFRTGEATVETLVMMILTDITESLRAEEQIRFLSYHDKLTSLYNRAHVEATLPELEKLQASPVSIILLDMNGLKLVNDVFGHQQGDLLLVSLAAVLKQVCRQEDIAARWGGDEFLILMPGASQQECGIIGERIRCACELVDNCAIPLSIAIGAATQAAGSIHFEEMFNIAESRMYSDKIIQGREVRRRIVASLEGKLREQCFESDEHSGRVRRLAVEFAEFLGFGSGSSEVKLLDQLATLHDIGKVAVPREVLAKTGVLTPGEWEIVKSHSDIGYRMAQSIGEAAVADVLLALHERWDGSGYPYGLKKDEIPLLARIFSLIEVYDVITHDRPYRAAMDKFAALQEIESGSGSQFDPGLTRRFVEFIRRR
ncbi:diguanylate cyclase domain-containing protein [Sporomusa aerivorans]|uniref:diguanylate cyclase domain-containing protein n=1 Tax=Sporomusa aerivorans TaxID=204936 RepID=UPI00352AA0A0